MTQMATAQIILEFNPEMRENPELAKALAELVSDVDESVRNGVLSADGLLRMPNRSMFGKLVSVVTGSASVDTRCRRRKNGSARNVEGNPSVFSAPPTVWDDPRGRRPSTAGADFMDMSLIRGMARGDHLNRRRRFAVTSYEKGAALEI